MKRNPIGIPHERAKASECRDLLYVLTWTVFAAMAACSDGGKAGERATAKSATPVGVGEPAPAYRGVSLSGDSVSLAALHGKVVLLNVWATWCHPCRDEIPELQRLHAKYNDQGLELVGVSVDVEGADADIRDFMKEFAMTYPIWRDPAERVSAQFLVVGVPTTFLIDRQGVLRWRKTGPIQPGDTTFVGALQRALRT